MGALRPSRRRADRRPSRRRTRWTLIVVGALGAAIAAALLPGSAGAGSGRIAHLRDAVMRGAAHDFAAGTGVGGPSFESCVELRLREALDPPTLVGLAVLYRRPDGPARAARALNALAAPLAASCGHRSSMPELVAAACGLRSGFSTGAARRILGVTYGPYLGKRCRDVGYRRCELVGIDVVFRRAATSVVAVAGDQRIRLRTPGKHSGIRFHDWVGNFTDAGFAHRRPAHRTTDLIYVPVALRVHFADGRRARALFPRVLVSSGWG